MKKLLLIACCLILLPVQKALAGYYSNNYQFIIGERAAGMGGAYTAIANDSTALWYNPAGLARISDMHLNISGNTYSYLKTTTEGFYQLPKYGGGSESVNMEESDFSVVANTLIFGKKLGDNQAVSFGLFIPSQDTLLGSMKAKDLTDIDGDKLNFKDDASLNSKYYVGMLGYGIQATDDLNIGASIGVGYYQAQYKDNTLLHVDYTATDPGTEELTVSQLSYDDTQYTLQAGLGLQYVQYEVDGIQQRVGLYIQTPTYRLSGNSEYEVVSYSAISNNYSSGDTWEKTPAKSEPFKQVLPGFISIGYGYEKPDSFGFSLDIVPTFSVSGDESDAKNPVVNIKAGLENYLTKSMILRAGFFTDFSQKDDVKATTDTPDGTDKINYYGGTLSLSFGKHLMETEIKEESAKIDIYGRPLETEVKKKGNKTVPTPVKRTLWSTFGIVARYGIGDVKVTRYDASYTDHPEIKDKSVLNFQAFIAESMSF